MSNLRCSWTTALIIKSRAPPCPLKPAGTLPTTTTHPPVHQSLETTHKCYEQEPDNGGSGALKKTQPDKTTDSSQRFRTDVVLNINLTHFESSIPVRSQSRQLVECNAKPWNCTSWLGTEACWEGPRIPFTLCLSTGSSPAWSLNDCSSVRPSVRDGFHKYGRRCSLLPLI